MKNYIYKDGYKHLCGGLNAREIKADEKYHGRLQGVYLFGKGYVKVDYGNATNRVDKD